MAPVCSFPPIADAQASILILGTMPGITSLRLRQYYGHPQNTFWKILGAVFDFDPAGSYAQRSAALRRNHVALWDVLASCHRPGSLDSDIDHGSIVPNDFGAFFARHRQVRRVCFNGAKAESLFRRHVLPHVVIDSAIELVRLPSTSPAHAGMPLQDKLRAWRSALAPATPAFKPPRP